MIDGLILWGCLDLGALFALMCLVAFYLVRHM
jgi:hypothetical protein